jgi:hypothetical protein
MSDSMRSFMNMKKHPFDIIFFTVAASLLSLLTIVVFIGAAAYDEGMTNNPTFYHLYNIFRFPTHTLFFDFFLRGGFHFFGGLLLNVLFYALLIERCFYYLRQRGKVSKGLLLAVVLLAFSSCTYETAFDRAKWLESNDVMSFPHRKFMVKDLVKNVPLKGMKYRDVLELLGPPQYPWDHVMKIQYVIEDDFGSDIDPVYSQWLTMRFNMDSMVRSVEVEEWRK